MALKEREKRTLLLGGMGFGLLLLLWVLLLRAESPWHRWLDLNDEIAQREDTLERMRRLQRRHIKLQAQTDKVMKRMATGEQGMVLSQGLVERLVQKRAPTADLKQMKQQDRPVHGIYRETEVKVELTRLTLEQLIDLLYALEYEEGTQVVRELLVELNSKNADLLDAEITIVSASPLNGGGEGETGK